MQATFTVSDRWNHEDAVFERVTRACRDIIAYGAQQDWQPNWKRLCKRNKLDYATEVLTARPDHFTGLDFESIISIF